MSDDDSVDVRRRPHGGGGGIGRRELIGAGLALGAMAAAGALGAAAPPHPPREGGLSSEGLLKGKAGFARRKPIALPYREIAGFLSRRQLDANYAVYRKDFRRLVTAERILATMPRGKFRSGDYRAMRAQQVEAANSVLLHEFYFRNMAVRPARPSGYVIDNINEHMGSMASWSNDFIACALAATTWALLVYDPYDDRWHNLPAGEGDAGGWVGANPLVVCDVASHAYLLNYSNREKYVARFLEHIDWNVVAARYRAVDRR